MLIEYVVRCRPRVAVPILCSNLDVVDEIDFATKVIDAYMITEARLRATFTRPISPAY